MANTVDKVLKIAEAEVGYLEKKSNNNLDNKTLNAGSANYTKYGKEMHDLYPSVMDFPAAWCDAFVDWCFYKAYGVTNAKGLLSGDFNDYTVSSANLYKNKNAWYTTPKVGDQIFFRNSTRICHTGLVYKVDNTYVYTIEGNTSGASGVIANGGGVCKKKYLLTYSRIAGYGRPKYDATKSIDDIVDAVINGEYGDGELRKTKVEAEGFNYEEVRTRVNELLKDKSSSVTITPTIKPVVTTPAAVKPTLKVSANVKAIQSWLNKFYGTNLVIDGVYGKKTKAALIKAWQKEVGGLTVDGDFGTKSKEAASKIILKKGSKGILVTILQATLTCQGFACSGGIDGDFGSGTHNAVIAFQKKKGLTRDGVVGKNTWSKLYA